MPTSRSRRPPSSPGCKRRDTSDKDHLTDSTVSSLPPWKKTKEPFKSAAEALAAYWDNLSTITLSPGFLRELDRRAPRPCRIAVESQLGPRSEEITRPSTELQRACRLGGLDFRYLRGYSSRKAANKPDSEMPYPIGTTDPTIGRYLDDHLVHPDDYRVAKPRNWDEIKVMVEQSRPVAPQTASYQVQYEAYRDLLLEVRTGPEVVDKIFPLLEGDNDVHSAKGHTLSHLEHLIDGNIAKSTPDYYDGANPEKVDKGLLAELSKFVLPLKKKKCPVFPSFFALLKAPDYSNAVAEQQARYAGAVGSRAIHKLRSFAVADPGIVYDDSAYTITAIYLGGIIRLNAHHPIKPSAPGGSVTYRMTLIDDFAINGSLSSFQRGVTALRNSREWARNKRDEFIAAATVRKQNSAITPVPDSPPRQRCILS